MSNNGIITSSTGKATSKTKVELGVPKSNVIIWLPFDVTEEDRELLGNYNSQLMVEQGISNSTTETPDAANYPLVDGNEYRKVHQLGRRIMHQWLEVNRTEIVATAEKFAVIAAKTPEELQKELQVTMARFAKLEQMLAAAQAAEAAAAAPVEAAKPAKK